MAAGNKRVAILLEQMYQDLEVWYPYYRLKEERVLGGSCRVDRLSEILVLVLVIIPVKDVRVVLAHEASRLAECVGERRTISGFFRRRRANL